MFRLGSAIPDCAFVVVTATAVQAILVLVVAGVNIHDPFVFGSPVALAVFTDFWVQDFHGH